MIEMEATQRRDMEVLGGVLHSPARCKVILSVRTEHLGRLMDQMAAGPERWRSYYLEELTAAQMLQAVLLPTSMEPVPYANEIPRQNYQFTFEPELASKLVHEVRKAAKDHQRSPLALLQTLGADLYDRMSKRGDHVINKADHKQQGPPEEAVDRYVANKIKELSLAPAGKTALRGLMSRLYMRHRDGTITRELVPTQEIADSWKANVPLETVIDAGAEGGLVEINQMLVRDQSELFLGLPQESLAQTVAGWEADHKRKAFGKTRIADTLWIMIPVLFLALVLTWTFTRNAMSLPVLEKLADIKTLEDPFPFYKVKGSDLDFLFKRNGELESQIERGRWALYVGDLVRAENAWRNDNPLLARQILLGHQVQNELDLRDFEWYYLWNKMVGKGPAATGHNGIINAVAISPDGATGASASMDGTVKVWNLLKVEEIATLAGHAGPVLAVAFSPDGKTIASGGTDKTIKLWSTPTTQDKSPVVTKEQKTLSGHTGAVRVLAFGPEGLVSGSDDKQVITWDLATGKEAKVFKDHTGAIQALALAPDGKTLASAGADQIILVHDGAKTTQTIKSPEAIAALAFSPDGKTLAAGGTEKQGTLERGLIRFWDPITAKETGAPIQHASGIFALAYVPNTKLLASAGKDNLIRLWDATSGRAVSVHKGHLGWIGTLAVSASGNTMISGSRDATIKIWDSLPPDTIAAHKGPAQAVLLAFEDKIAISGGLDGKVKFWDPATGRRVAELTAPGGVTSLAFSIKDNTGILAAGTVNDKNEGEIRLWEVTFDAKEGLKTKELPALKGHVKGVTCLAFSPDGKTLALRERRSNGHGVGRGRHQAKICPQGTRRRRSLRRLFPHRHQYGHGRVGWKSSPLGCRHGQRKQSAP